MTSSTFIKTAKKIAQKYKTLYVMGCFGAPLNAQNKIKYCSNNIYNKSASRTALIKAATSDTFGFDCVCLIKSILWGFKGDKTKAYGGAVYASGKVPDIDADTMIKTCSGVSTDFGTITEGEVVWLPGHIGIYIGGGLAVECTPSFKNRVQITAVYNIGKKSGYYGRYWVKHGKLPYITYPKKSTKKAQPAAALKVGDKVVVNGKIYYFGNGGNSILKTNEKMYVTDIINKKDYKYYIGVAARKNGVRQGWTNANTVKKI